MDFTAKTDKTQEKELDFVTFKPDIMDAIYEGNSFPADIEIQTSQGKMESVIVKAYLPDARETAENTRAVIMAVVDMLCSKIDVPPEIKDNHFNLIAQFQKDGLK